MKEAWTRGTQQCMYSNNRHSSCLLPTTTMGASSNICQLIMAARHSIYGWRQTWCCMCITENISGSSHVMSSIFKHGAHPMPTLPPPVLVANTIPRHRNVAGEPAQYSGAACMARSCGMATTRARAWRAGACHQLNAWHRQACALIYSNKQHRAGPTARTILYTHLVTLPTTTRATTVFLHSPHAHCLPSLPTQACPPPGTLLHLKAPLLARALLAWRWRDIHRGVTSIYT